MSNQPKAALRWDPSAIQNGKTVKRSKLHVSSTVDWLKRRHKNTANMQYLLLPNELQQHKEVRNIFEVFDEDNSGKLTLDEFYNMLQQAHITIKMEDLQEFYAKVDDNRDEALDFTEFKNSTLSDQANFHFAKMMAKVRSEAEAQLQIKKKEKKDTQKNKRETEKTEGDSEKQDSERIYLPRTFGNLLNFLTYENKKHDLINFVKGNNSLGDKFKKFSQLLELQMDKDIYLEKLNQRFQHKFSTTRSTQSLSPTRIEKVVQPKVESKVIQNLSPSDSESEEKEDERVAANEKKQDDKQKVKPKFFEELAKISENARKEAHEEFFQEVRRKDKHISMPPLSNKEAGSTNDLTRKTTATRKSLFEPQPLYPKFEEDVKRGNLEHGTSIMNHPNHDSSMEHGSSNQIPSSTNIRNTPQSQFFKSQFPRSVTHSKTSTPKRPQRAKLAGIVGGTRSSSLIPKAPADSSERVSFENHHESIMQPSKVVFNDYNFASQPSYRDQSHNQTKHKFIPSFSEIKSPKDQEKHAQVSSKILEARITTYIETQPEASLPLISPKGSVSILRSQRDSLKNQNNEGQPSTFSKNKQGVSLNLPIKEEGQEEVLLEKVVRKASRMPTDYTCISPHYDHALNKTTSKRRAKTFLMKIVPSESAARLTSPKSCTNQLAKTRALASTSQAEIKRDSSQSEVKKVDLNFTVHANTASEKERSKGKRIFTTTATTVKRSSLKPNVVNQIFDPIRNAGIESKYMIPSLGIDK